ncbi:MAG: hypothetical protein JNM93_08555 [Bacteriovoracaceae bacterium]|nr:hypothetical protein [Bacteriovoracaceae bacterium]
MKHLMSIILMVFSFTLYDINLFRYARSYRLSQHAIQWALDDIRQKNRRQQKKYKNRKYQKAQNFQLKFYKLRGTRPKSHRYSNQKSLRRMFRNS